MTIIERIFGEACVLQPDEREDNRGEMSVCYSQAALAEKQISFRPAEQRIYRIPKAGTFFGVHYQEMAFPQARLVTVLKGCGLDYIVDLRRDSPTCRQWKAVELSGGNALMVYLPAGFGHGFLSTADETIQLFSVDAPFREGSARNIHYTDPAIGLMLPVADPILSEWDENAPVWED